MDVRPRARVPAPAAAVAALTLVALTGLTGCGGAGDSNGDDGVTSPATTVTAPPAPARSAITDADVLPDGRWYGHITSIDLARRRLTFDLAQWFTGDAATAAAREDGAIASDDVASDDLYVRDESHRLRSAPLADRVVVTTVQCPTGCAQYAGRLEPLAASFGHETHSLEGPYHGNFLGYWLTIEHGDVARIDEQYTP